MSLIKLETAKLAKVKGFICEIITGNKFFDTINNICEQSELQTWLRDKHNIEIFVLPLFRDRCGYDSFKREGYTYEIIKNEPCQILMHSDFNKDIENIEDEIKLEGKLLSYKPNFKTYEDALEDALINGLNLIL